MELFRRTQETLSTIRKDWVRHGSDLNSGFLTLLTYRYGNWTRALPLPARWLASKLYGGMFVVIQWTAANSIYREVKLGEDPHLMHAQGIFIHPGVQIGDRCGIMHRVTIGTTRDREGVPKIGNDVFIGAGAILGGPITIGDGAIIAANSVVVTDVPPGATAIGVPARVLRVAPNTEDKSRASGNHTSSKSAS
jgi:serine O-acetyltransferase